MTLRQWFACRKLHKIVTANFNSPTCVEFRKRRAAALKYTRGANA